MNHTFRIIPSAWSIDTRGVMRPSDGGGRWLAVLYRSLVELKKNKVAKWSGFILLLKLMVMEVWVHD